MKAFHMIRQHDTSKVSGIGHVLDGIIFDDGKTVVKWRGDKSSIGIFNEFRDFLAVHVDSHPENETKIIWLTMKEEPT